MPTYALLFVLFAVVLIAAYFYLMRAKSRGDASRTSDSSSASADQGDTR